jgi:hypothetical protein
VKYWSDTRTVEVSPKGKSPDRIPLLPNLSNRDTNGDKQIKSACVPRPESTDVYQLVDPLHHPAERRHHLPVLVRRPVPPAPHTPISRHTNGQAGNELGGATVLEDVVLLVDGDGVRDGDGGGGRGGGREGLELVERRLEADPLGLVQREVEVPHGRSLRLGSTGRGVSGWRRSGNGAAEGEVKP